MIQLCSKPQEDRLDVFSRIQEGSQPVTYSAESPSLAMSAGPFRVLLLGGQSGSGKSTVARHMERHLDMSWLQVDDLRLALQRSQVTLPRHTDDLYYFLETKDVWRQSPELLRDRLIAVGELMFPAIEVVVEHHIDQNLPAVVEGDGILPVVEPRPWDTLIKRVITAVRDIGALSAHDA
jgi:hypothetical protein